MESALPFALVAWLVPFASATALDEIPNPRSRGGWVSDLADVLPPDAEDRINRRIEDAHRAAGVEIAVVTVPDVDGTPKDFATALLNRWGVGSKDRDDGLLVLLVKDRRRLEMETGYGLEGTLPDGWLGSMQATTMVPLFKQGDYAAGLEAGVAQVVARLTGGSATAERPGASGSATTLEDLAALGASPAPPRGAASAAVVPEAVVPDAGGSAEVVRSPSRSGESDPTPIFLFIGLGLVTLGGGAWWAARRGRMTCEGCGTKLVELSEAEEGAHLNEGQISEQVAHSVNWRVRVCPKCDRVHLHEHAWWLFRKPQCMRCTYRTVQVTTHTIVPPTYHSSGLGERRGVCAHCGDQTLDTFVIPRRQRSSSGSGSGFGGSSGGSSGGSFGGGSSGGGGAGSSW